MRNPKKPPDPRKSRPKTPQIRVRSCREPPLDKQNTYSISSAHPTSRRAAIATTNHPRHRAGKAKDNLYRDTLDDHQIRILALAANRIGLADETQMLRVYVHDAMKNKDSNSILKFMPMLARIEEARARIDARPEATPVSDPTIEALQAMVDQLKTLTQPENRI